MVSTRALRSSTKKAVVTVGEGGESCVSPLATVASPSSVDSKTPALPTVLFLSPKAMAGLPSVSGAPLSLSSVGVASAAVSVSSNVLGTVTQASVTTDAETMQNYMSSIWRNQESASGGTVFWEVQYVPLN